MEGVRIQNKLKMLYEEIVKPGYVMNNYYADGLINKISNCSDPEIADICSMPLMSDMMVNCLEHVDNVDNMVKVFIIRSLGIVSTKELHFSKMICLQSNKILKGFKEINSPTMNASLRVAYMEVALSVVKHNSGINWLLETGLWKEILTLCNEKRTVFVVRQTYKFAAQFLWRLNDLGDLSNIILVLDFLLQPLTQIDFLTVENLASEQEDELAKTIDPTLHILAAIMDCGNRIEKSSLLLDYLVKNYQIATHLYVIFDRLHREETVLLLGKLIFWFVFPKTFFAKPAEPGVKYTKEDLLDLSVSFFNIVKFFVQRRNAGLTLDFCTACHMIFWKICKDTEKIGWEVEGRQIVFRNQILFMCLVPLVMFVKHGKPKGMSSDDKIEEFTMKILNSTCEHTTKAAYALKNLLEELDTMSIIVQSVKKLSCLKGHLDDAQANLVFQALYYILREFDPIDDYGNPKQEESYQQYENDQDKVVVMTYVMDTVLCLLKNYDINWRESVEVVCLYTMVYNILQRPNLTTKFVIASLNVISLTVKKFLPPNLSLLLESKPGSSMDKIGKLIYMKMHDLSWEVRDSALELLLVCTEISFVKFPPFQKQILENNLINVAAAIAFNDFESYVQVSALRCLGAASKVAALWEQLIAHYPIQDQLLHILSQNPEGIVRKEASVVLCDLYQNLKLAPAFKHSLYEHMVSAALSDFHWEVQITALKFWRIVFQSLLTDQGMLDGTFPPVTFSRETRKIVTLNEAEIQRRLIKILDELSSVGLLTVLMKLLHTDTEVDVQECALCLSQELIDILNKYKVIDYLKPKPGETAEDILGLIKQEEEEDSEMIAETSVMLETPDNIIEGILNASDINLLASIYERHMSLQNVKKDEPLQPKIRLGKVASPHTFVQFMKEKDYKADILEKRNWNNGIRSLSSLLDDVLGIYEVNNEVNSLDCY